MLLSNVHFFHLHNRIVSAQWKTQSIQILYTVPPKNCFFRWGFLFACRKRHARFRSVFSSYQLMVKVYFSHIRLPRSYLAHNVLRLKSHRNVNVVGCTKFATHLVTLGSRVHQFSIYELSGTFFWNNSLAIPFVSENQEKSWKQVSNVFLSMWCQQKTSDWVVDYQLSWPGFGEICNFILKTFAQMNNDLDE